MASSTISLPEIYWSNFTITEQDVAFLYNHLFEKETPMPPEDLICELINERIKLEKKALINSNRSGGKVYLPKEHYTIGEILSFPALEWQKGKVVSVRAGNNPEVSPFEVIEVELENGECREFASALQIHTLNDAPAIVMEENEYLNPNLVYKTFGDDLTDKLIEELESNPDLVRIAGNWFPRALLVDVNMGYLNLAEAVLEMENGGPLTTCSILEQIELPTDVNLQLSEFSLNLALQEDGRFDEVGPKGEVLWYLKRLEPAEVQSTPKLLKYYSVEYNKESIQNLSSQLSGCITDELETEYSKTRQQPGVDEIEISLIYPHWRSGTLPISGLAISLFPTALESERVRFDFVDGNSGDRFEGWVVISDKYAYGLSEWYKSQGAMPGSLVHVQRSNHPGEVIVRMEKRRSSRDWIRTTLIGADSGIVFAMLKQLIPCAYDERMGIAVTDPDALDRVWDLSNKQRGSLEHTIVTMMRELAKLNPQGHVHAQEIYAAVNLVRRCPPGPILSLLVEKQLATHLGDLYFRLDEHIQEA